MGMKIQNNSTLFSKSKCKVLFQEKKWHIHQRIFTRVQIYHATSSSKCSWYDETSKSFANEYWKDDLKQSNNVRRRECDRIDKARDVILHVLNIVSIPVSYQVISSSSKGSLLNPEPTTCFSYVVKSLILSCQMTIVCMFYKD